MLTVPAEPGRLVKANGEILHRCPFRDEEDRGEVEVSWRTNGKTLELHALTEWFLTAWRDRLISHEDLTGEIRSTLACHRGIENVSVTTYWSTAGMNVEVRG